MKTDNVFKRAYNETLDLLSHQGKGAALPPETRLSSTLGVSRTTVRKVLSELVKNGVVEGQGRERVVRSLRKGLPRFPKTETVTTAAQVERKFMEWMLRDNAAPGTVINELELARQFGVATTGIREFLNRFQRFGLIEKRPNAGWMFKGFTIEFSLELFEIREMFELRSARAFAKLPRQSALWEQLAAIRAEHLLLLKEFERRPFDFSDLDRRFHELINEASPNRFIDGFYDIIAMIFHYHYQWNKTEEKKRNRAAIHEHLAYIDALRGQNLAAVEKACRKHLRSARQTLIEATAQL